MKHNILLFAALIAFISVCAQDEKIPDGVYLNVQNLQKHTPTYTANLMVYKMERRNQDVSTTNEFELRPGVKDTTSMWYIKHNMYAYVKDGSVYLNCRNFGLKKGYALCLTEGEHLAFYSVMPDDKLSREAVRQGFIYGFFGIVDGTRLINQHVPERYVYVLNMRSGKVTMLNQEYLYSRCEKYPDLQERYCNELIPDRDRVLIRYTDLLNKREMDVKSTAR